MSRRIGLTVLEDGPEAAPFSRDSIAPALKDPAVTLRFGLKATDRASLEAVRYARRAVLREERTLGVDEGEPLLEEAEFSATEIRWRVPAARRESCLDRLMDLIARANRVLEQSGGGNATPREAETGRES
jgi:hypothetical protein